jgi:hypothetical protein
MSTMNVVWAPPVSFDDLNAVSSMLSKSPSIVAAWDDFCSGDWKEFFQEHEIEGTDFYAHLDANFLSQLLRLFSSSAISNETKVASALMCLAVVFDMKMNPTFATHEYAFTGSDPPDSRLAGFNFINNLHPQFLADVALGRVRNAPFPRLDSLPPTKHVGTHRQRLRMDAIVYTSLLKVVEMDRRLSTSRGSLAQRATYAEQLQDWMFHDFIFCGAPLKVSDQLWGQHRQKTVLKGIERCDASNVLQTVRNATWDLVLAENWAEYESKRKPGDPFHLIFTFDRSVRAIASRMLMKPTDRDLTEEDLVLKDYRSCWPEPVARSLAGRYLAYVQNLESPARLCNSSQRPSRSDLMDKLERQVLDLYSS